MIYAIQSAFTGEVSVDVFSAMSPDEVEGEAAFERHKANRESQMEAANAGAAEA